MNRTVFAGIAAAALSAPALAQQQSVLPQPAAIAATRAALVNGKPIPKSRVDTVVRQQAARGVADTDELRKAVVERLVNFELVAQEADKKGLTRSTDLREQIALARQQVIFEAYMTDHFKFKPISDAAVHAEYDRIKSQRGDKEYKARHVLVDSEAQAKELIAELDKGAKIEELAKQSKDVGSRERGGDLNWNTPANFVKQFAEAMVKLEKGKYTRQPVHSQFGWHVIQLDDVRAAQFPPFDKVKPQIQNMLQEREVQAVFAALRSKAKIE